MGYQNIDTNAIIESGVLLDKVHPKGLHVGAGSLVAARSVLLSHEHVYRSDIEGRDPYICDTYIGKNCFIGIGTIVLPGVTIGDEVMIGAGSVVTKDIPSYSFAAGNPARVIKTGVSMNDKAWVIKK